jgi:peptidoglycan hydrolase-like protein with peptidoglycan-binding domain
MGSADIDAINTYITSAAIQSPEAGNLQAQWKTWYGNLGMFDKMSDSTTAEASNRRTVFNAANHQPEALASAADLTPQQMVAKQDAIAQAPGLSPAQKQVALAANPTIPTSHPGIAGAANHSTIRLGSTGADVSTWQGIVGVPVTGKFDSATATATRAYQTAHKLTADGVVGPQTWATAMGAPLPAIKAAAPSGAAKPLGATFPGAVAAPPPGGSGSVLKIALPAGGIVGGFMMGGPVGALVGGVLGLFAGSKVP